MRHDAIRIFRLYCNFSIEQVAKATGIKEKRIKEIEQGNVVPENEELEKLALLYNVQPEMLNGTITDICGNVVNESIDFSLFKNDFERELIQDKITSLSELEKMIILMFRSSQNKPEAYGKIIDVLSETEHNE